MGWGERDRKISQMRMKNNQRAIGEPVEYSALKTEAESL